MFQYIHVAINSQCYTYNATLYVFHGESNVSVLTLKYDYHGDYFGDWGKLRYEISLFMGSH